MLKNMFKTAWRTSIRHKQFTLLNILGLSIGVTTCLIIGLYVQDELSYDSFHKDSDRIYRVNQSFIWGDWDEQMANTGPNLGIALRTDVPEFEQVTRVLPTEPFAVAYRNGSNNINSFLQENLFAVEENFFNVFSFEIIQGDRLIALSQPFKVVITEEMAIKYFGDENALGKTLHMKGTILEGSNAKPEQWQSFEVSAVIKNLPANSHIKFDMLTTMSSYPEIQSNASTWVWTAYTNYALVKEGVNVKELEAKLQSIPPKWAANTLERVFGQTFKELEGEGKSWNLYLQPLSKVYLDAKIGNPLGPKGSFQYISIFSAVGLIILLLSSINFMNLSTARSSGRAKEVGIRKVLGAQRKSLIKQFIFESFLFVAISTIIAIVTTELFLTTFNNIAQKELSLYAYLTNPIFLTIAIGFVFVLALLAGIYPSLYLSSFRPIAVLKGQLSSGVKGKGIRNMLVVFQFTSSIALIVSTFFVHKQLNFSTTFDLGYNKEHVLQLHNIERLGLQVDAIKNSLANNPSIQSIGQSHEVPPNIHRGDIIQAEGSTEGLEVQRMKVDEQYMELLSPNWLAGRNFDKNITTDENSAIILNAAAVKTLGYGNPDNYKTDSPIGKFVIHQDKKFEIIGVVEDFHYNSIRQLVLPLVIYHINNPFLPDSGTSPSFLSLRLNQQSGAGDGLQSLIKEIQMELTHLDDSFPFEYSFMDQSFENSFRNEQRMGQILNIFTVMAIIIACLGLFGLAAFSAEQRTKELGIRKVLGAKALHLVVLFSSEFTKLVLIALLIATPVSYYFVDTWLENFAYKTPISAWAFLLAGISALLISWSTVAYQSLKTARLNPVDSLKDE
uniref:ABC transporter permease n=1 Tax=Roseivirga sp. TaxID=1964215 RepID=UPI004048322E